MFDLPRAKRVRRSELYSPRSSLSASRSPSPSAAARLQAHFESLYGGAASPAQPSEDVASAKGGEDRGRDLTGRIEDEEEEYEFRLFAPGAKAPIGDVVVAANTTKSQAEPTAIARISIHDPEAADAGFMKQRSSKYYFTELEGIDAQERKQEFADVAVEGDQIRLWALKPWPGCALPWRVTRLLGPKQPKDMEPNLTELPLSTAEELDAARKRKPGKKRRVILRKRLEKINNAKAQRETIAAEKERQEQEKRTRRNREKKLKRKQKEKAVKAAGDVTVEGGAGEHAAD